MKYIVFSLFVFVASVYHAFSQQPRYTYKSFVNTENAREFVPILPKKDGFQRTFLLSQADVWDLDDDRTTWVRGSVKALLCFEGNLKNGKQEGIFSVYVIDSANHSKRYKIWEQEYQDDQLNGQWRTYTLKGTLVNFKTFKNDKQLGLSRDFGIDGKTIIGEQDQLEGEGNFIRRSFHKNGKIEKEVPHVNNEMMGIAKKYYPDGVIQEIAEFRKGELHGNRKYFYPNGQLWIEQVYKDDKAWEVIANYTANGQKRDAGSLKDGNGTVIFYNEDNSVRETVTYVNGILRR